MTETEILDDLLTREGGYTDHSADRGGATNMGITARVLGEWRGLGRPARREEVKALTRPEAIAIYRRRYIEAPGFTEEAIPYGPLRAQVIDDGVLSGTVTAIKTLQRVLGVKDDGVLGPVTRAVACTADGPSVHRAYLKARVLRLVRIAQRDVSQLVFLGGWVQRALSFVDT